MPCSRSACISPAIRPSFAAVVTGVDLNVCEMHCTLCSEVCTALHAVSSTSVSDTLSHFQFVTSPWLALSLILLP